MIKLLRWLLGLCNHEWEPLNRQLNISERDKPSSIIGHRWYYQCSKCKRVRAQDYWL